MVGFGRKLLNLNKFIIHNNIQPRRQATGYYKQPPFVVQTLLGKPIPLF
jgi:hypothetical protein